MKILQNPEYFQLGLQNRGVQWSVKMQTTSGINYSNIVHENQGMSMDGITDPWAKQGHLQGVEWEVRTPPGTAKRRKEKQGNVSQEKREVMNEKTEDYLYAKV